MDAEIIFISCFMIQSSARISVAFDNDA